MSVEHREFPMDRYSSLCQLMPRPQLVTGLLVQWMRLHFSEAPNIEDPDLRETLWALDITTTGIVIDSVYRWNPQQTEQRPGIFVKRGPWKILRYGIDDRKMIGYGAPSGNQTYNNFTQGSHVLFCVANKPAEAELLGAEVYRELMMFGPMARRFFNFLRFVVTDVGELSLLEECAEHFVVPITVSYGAQDVWELAPNAPKLKSLKFTTFLP